MWLYPAALVGLCYLLRWYRERQVVSNLRDKYVFITGCDSGFGNQLARQLDLRGLRVLAACLTEKGAEQLRDRTSDRLETVILDVTKTESIAAATQWVKECTGDRGLWGLVNNAGIGVPAAPNEWLTKDDFLKILNVNLIGLIEVTLSLLPLIRKTRGRVVNVSSPAGRLSVLGGGYCISKFGVEAFSDSLRRELCPFGVRVAIIVPGNFKTSICPDNVQDLLKGLWSQASPEVKKRYGDKYFEGYCQYYNKLTSLGQKDLSLVTNCMEHALTAVHPSIHYSAGWDAVCFTLPLSCLPTSVADFILSLFANAVRPADAV
ncbi:retinol dehydrogenase 7-like [Equus quagga]|uniref:retinol dehydrogenase 7-like n=1 Tax=Equus quagga TaxID=89248 RepID=UPI001EE2F013|nr:retinol dehydrogenase 7-like [Equus quagga]XP_046505080.1 retinol dehydrogenase 7-like [Equus quagga]